MTSPCCNVLRTRSYVRSARYERVMEERSGGEKVSVPPGTISLRIYIQAVTPNKAREIPAGLGYSQHTGIYCMCLLCMSACQLAT